MLEIVGNIWDYHDKGFRICITTNGFVKKDNRCVMGAGVALQAKQRYPDLPKELGKRILFEGNRVFFFPQYKIFSFPVKHVWWEKADLDLIRESAIELARIEGSETGTYLTRPGCNNGGRTWEEVKPYIEPHLDDRFIICDWADIGGSSK